MKKIILSIFFVLLSISFIADAPVFAAEERWTDGNYELKAQRAGNSITIIYVTGGLPRYIGVAALAGTINGTTFTGTKHLFADECPSLDWDAPATGTVSADGNSISVTFTNSEYRTESCVRKENSEFEDSRTYTKISPQNTPAASTLTMKLSPTPTEAPLDLNGTWTAVNEKGTSFTLNGRHTGNSLSLQITDVSDDTIEDSIGKTSLSGTLSGHELSGTHILIAYAPKCLGKYFNTDVAGAVVADGSSITVSYTNFKYNVDTCAKVPGTEFQGSITYVRADKGQNPTSGKDVERVSPSPEITKIAEDPPVGVSSKDFRELVRANAEYQKAKAELEEIKKANDPRWEEKKDFPDEYNSELDKVASQEVKDNLKIARTGLERIRDAASAYGDIKDIRDALGGDSGPYGRVSLASDLIGGATDFIDLIGDDVSVGDAAVKVGIDTVVPNALYTIPILKAADTVLNVPDKIANALGVGEDNWYRKNSTGFLKDHSISSFVKLTTSAMIETGSWTNLGGALVMAWDDIKSAEGFGEKAQATLDLVGTAVGAVPVGLAMQLRDEVSTLFNVMKFSVSSAGNYVSSWFTLSN